MSSPGLAANDALNPLDAEGARGLRDASAEIATQFEAELSLEAVDETAQSGEDRPQRWAEIVLAATDRL